MSFSKQVLFLNTIVYLFDQYSAQNPEHVFFRNETTQDLVFINDPIRPHLGYPRSLSFLFIFATLLVGVLVRAVMLRTSMCIPYRVVMFVFGSIVGYCGSHFPNFRPIVLSCFMDGDFMLLLFLPIIVFTTSYTMDTHSFYKSFLQILLVAVPGALLTSLMAAFISYNVIDRSLDFPTCMLFGIICAPIYPREVVRSLKETPKGKYLGILLLGEELIGDVTVMIVFTAIFGYIAMAVTKASQIFLLILRFTGGGILLGILTGKITSTIMVLTYNDVICTVTVTIASAYLTFYIGEKFLYVSGLLATIVAGVIIGKSKSRVASHVEQVVASTWHLMSHATNTLLFTTIGAIIFERVPNILTLRNISLILVTYVTVFCARLLVYGLMLPMLKRLGYGMRWQFSMACVWGGIRGPLSLCLSLIIMDTRGLERVGQIFIIQVTGLVLLTLLINATAIGKILKALGFSEISLAKKANMTNCVRRIMMTRDRCISMLKMDKFLADANWELVQEDFVPKTLKKTAIPSLFPWNDNKIKQSTLSNEPDNLTVEKVTATYAKACPVTFVQELPYINHLETVEFEEDPLRNTEYPLSTEPQDIMTVADIFSDYIMEITTESDIENRKQNDLYLDKEVQTLTDEKIEVSVQTEYYLPKSRFSVYNYKNNDQGVHFFTGLQSFDKFIFVFNLLGSSAYELNYRYGNPPIGILVVDYFFITLLILRRHNPFEYIAAMFQTTIKQVYNIFTTWIRFISLQFKSVDLWLDREKNKAYMSLDFFAKYPMTRLILDATEFPIQKPSLPSAQQITFSSYKNRNTVKALIGITPSGLITYVSPCYGGSATDRQIIERSNIFDKFNYNDEIMVDKGLNVQDIFIPYGVKVNMPSFFKKGNQINPETLVSNRKVASKRVHVERVIGMLKTYKILTEPMNQTETILSSDIVYVCAMLVNFRSSIMSK